nr:late secretory pathway protein avl9 [Polyrhizophydium stewartii]
MVEYAHPPLPSVAHARRSTESTDTKIAIELPDEWSFMDLLNKTADVTRTKVQKAVVVLATQPILGSIRSKLGLVTQAFFAQRDFTKVEILDTLYENLENSVYSPYTDTILYAGISLRELIFKFRHKTLQLVKLLLLGKRVLFFGQKVERLSAYQYGLISLFPELLRHLEDVGSPALANLELKRRASRKVSLNSSARSMDLLRQHNSESHKTKMHKLGHPLRIFGEGAFFQPYIPLQQIDVIMSPETKSFLVGTSNAIFTHHKACNIDAVAYADNGNLEFINPQVAQLATLTAADRKFIDDDMTMNQQIEYEGSDEDIRSRFESYLTQLFASVKYDQDTPAVNQETGARKTDYLSEYHSPFVRAWETTPSFQIWSASVDRDALMMINPGHPNHGYSALGEMSTQLTARLTELGKNMTPIQSNLSRAFTTASTTVAASVSDAVTTMSDPAIQPNLQGRQPEPAKLTTQIFGNLSAWYTQRRKEWLPTQAPEIAVPVQETETDDGYNLVDTPGDQKMTPTGDEGRTAAPGEPKQHADVPSAAGDEHAAGP